MSVERLSLCVCALSPSRILVSARSCMCVNSTSLCSVCGGGGRGAERDEGSRRVVNSIQIFVINFKCLVACFATILYSIAVGSSFVQKFCWKIARKSGESVFTYIACDEVHGISCWASCCTQPNGRSHGRSLAAFSSSSSSINRHLNYENCTKINLIAIRFEANVVNWLALDELWGRSRFEYTQNSFYHYSTVISIESSAEHGTHVNRKAKRVHEPTAITATITKLGERTEYKIQWNRLSWIALTIFTVFSGDFKAIPTAKLFLRCGRSSGRWWNELRNNILYIIGDNAIFALQMKPQHKTVGQHDFVCAPATHTHTHHRNSKAHAQGRVDGVKRHRQRQMETLKNEGRKQTCWKVHELEIEVCSTYTRIPAQTLAQ